MKCGQDGKTYYAHITCDELPEMNDLDSFHEGQEKNMDHPLVGGKATVIEHLLEESLCFTKRITFSFLDEVQHQQGRQWI